MTASVFAFYTERRLIGLTGVQARSLEELRDALIDIPGASVFYHTHQAYLSHHFKTPRYYNDFALWASEELREEALAEKLTAIDLLAFTSIRQLREAIVATIDDYLVEIGRASYRCPPEGAFHFCKSMSFVVPTGIEAADIPDFFAKLPLVSSASLYFHFFEARLRLEHPTNDFSRWLGDLGRPDLAQQIDRLDPYTRSLDQLKEEIIRVGASHLP
jgi:hypothetical protein